MNQIKHCYTGSVLYEYDSGMTLRSALEKATTEKAYLQGANLYGANLYGANLYGANLRGAYLQGAYLQGADLQGAYLYGADLQGAYLQGANLYGADLQGANLYGANLYGANLRGANLRGADLYGADLYGADLQGASVGEHSKLVGKRPFFQCGPIGSRSDYLFSFITDKGIIVKAGCFTGTLDEFRTAVEKTHGENDHGNEYAMAMLMVEAHASLWMPKEEMK